MRRHDRVLLRPGAAVRLLGAADAAAQAAVGDWLAAGRPLVAARQRPEEPGVVLALALPARQERRRLALLAAPGDVAGVLPPFTVAEVTPCLDAATAEALGELAARLATVGASLGVYGSLAWEVIAGEAYRHPGSDIDVVCDLQQRAQLAPALAALEAAAGRLALRLDGEVRFADGAAVAWREWQRAAADPARSVLAKGFDFLAVTPVARLLDTLA